MSSALKPELINLLGSFGTCVISDAIEAFDVRLRNEGFATAGFRCLFKNRPPMVGYATTCKIRSATPPIVGSRYIERTDWWKYILSTPTPRVVVMQDIDAQPGTGAFLGRVHANILMALGCVGAVTNGAARELPGIEASGLQVFAGRLAISRAYVHIVGFGEPVEIGGLTVRPGDLIHGDRHGILTIPAEIAAQLPDVARQILDKKQNLVELARRPKPLLDEVARELKELYDLTGRSQDHQATPRKK